MIENNLAAEPTLLVNSNLNYDRVASILQKFQNGSKGVIWRQVTRGGSTRPLHQMRFVFTGLIARSQLVPKHIQNASDGVEIESTIWTEDNALPKH